MVIEQIKTGLRANTPITEIQRVAHLMKIDWINVDDIFLCVKIQDKIRELQKENKKLNFTNMLIKQANEFKENRIGVLERKVEELKKVGGVIEGANNGKSKDAKDKVYMKLKNDLNEKECKILCLKDEVKYYEKKLKLNLSRS